MRRPRVDADDFAVIVIALAVMLGCFYGATRGTAPAAKVPQTLRALAAEHGCWPDFQWNADARECFVDNLSIEIDCDTARAAQTVPHSIAVEVRWPDAEVGKVIMIDVREAIGDEWRAYCESTEPEP